MAHQPSACIEEAASKPQMGSIRVKKYMHHGSISSVFLGTFRGRGCVVKRYFAENSTEFQRERDVLRLLNCPHVARLVVAGKSRTLGFNFEGADLSLLIGQGAVDRALAESISVQILRGMDYIHSRGIVHFDIKPSNILYNGTRAMLIDFGSAKYDGEAISQYNCTNSFCSLEYLLGYPTARPCKDIWSFGCVLYELLCGRPLFESEAALGVVSEILNVFGSPANYERLELKHMALVSVAGHRPCNPELKFGTVDGRHRTLLMSLMELDPDARASASDVLELYGAEERACPTME